MATQINLYSKEQADALFDAKANSADVYTKTQSDTLLGAKQDTLVSGTNIKTINGTAILGSGDISISGGGSTVTITQATGYYVLSVN